MTRFFTINGKRYTAKPLTFNAVCELEDMGVSLAEMSKKSMSTARAYLAICADIDKEEAGGEIEAHVVAGGNINELFNVFTAEINESGFFQGLRKNQEETAPTETEETPKEKAAKAK